MRRRLISLLLLFLATLAVDGGLYCSQETPLLTEYIVPFYKATRTVTGCTTSERTPKTDLQIVVVRINTTSSDVFLTITDSDITSNGVVLILDSPKAIRWSLTFFGSDKSSHSRQVILSPGSVVTDSNAKAVTNEDNDAYSTAMGLSPEMGTNEMGTHVKRHFGALTVLAQVAEVNQVGLSLSKRSELDKCDLSAPNQIITGNTVQASLVMKQTMFGCYHAEIAGTLASDVHVIDLITADPSQQLRSSRSASAGANDVLPSVVLRMTPKNIDGTVDRRNLTLVLKSTFPVRWYLESWKLEGQLDVVSTNGPVENHSLSSRQNLNIERKPLPDDFEQLWRAIIDKTGAVPMSYVKVDLANVVSMVIPPRSKRGLGDSFLNRGHAMTANLVPDAVPAQDDAPRRGGSNGEMVQKTDDAIPRKMAVNEVGQQSILDDKIKQLERDLGVLLVKQCNQRQSVITLPRQAVAKFNVSHMTLNEQNCAAVKNDTHWILTTRSTSCGSLSIARKIPMMRNNIHLIFTPGSDFYGREVRIPFTCKFTSGFTEFGPTSNVDGRNNDDYDTSEDSADEMYTMRILRKRSQGGGRSPEVLVSHQDDEASVSVGDQLKVQTDFSSSAPLSLVIERCWIADNAASDQRHLAPEEHLLIYEGCAANSNVTMLSTPLGSNPAFTFTVTDEHRRMSQLYLFCIMGLCSPMESLTKGNLEMCVDPVTKCASNDWHVGPAAQHLSKRGPLFVQNRRLKVEFDTSNFSAAASSNNNFELKNGGGGGELAESPSLHSSHVVMVGVPVEIAVAIALVSFIIGATLTGMLCCIHHRKATPKSLRSHVDENHDGSELQSMIASPSLPPLNQPSKANATATGAGVATA